MKDWVKITLLIVVIFIAVGSFYYLMFGSLFEGTAPVSQKSYLELNIYGEVPERESIDPFTKLFAGEPPSLYGLLQCIQKAEIDPNILGIILKPMGSNMGWAKVEELRTAITNFKKSGKPVYVYLEVAGNSEYYLSVKGDMLFGSPTGTLFVNGLLGSSYFFKGTLDKIGVKADFVAKGKYKNAPDMFSRKNMSDAQREVLNAILDDYFNRYVNSVAEDRNINQSEITDLFNRGLFSIEESYEHGLIDTLLYYNEFKEYLKEKENLRRMRIVSYDRYKKIPMSELGVKAKKNIALVYAVGNIVSGIGDEASEDGLVTSESMSSTLRRLGESDNIKAIILRIDSPGGSGTASDIIWKEVVEAQKNKPVIVSMSNVAASGGYYIAMAADTIIAQPSSIVGSIGVFAGKFSFDGLYEKLGINKEEIPRGENADLFSETKTFSENEKELLNKFINDFYKTFVTKVADGRNKSYDEINRVAQGRIWTGSQAVENGLVDLLGGIQEAVQVAKELANIPLEEAVNVRLYPKRHTFLQRLLSSGLSQGKIHYALDILPQNIQNYVLGFVYFKDYEPLTIMPFYPEVK